MELSFSPDEKKGFGGGGGARGGGSRSASFGSKVVSNANRGQLPQNNPKPGVPKAPTRVERVAQVVKNAAGAAVMGALPVPAKIVAAVFKPQPAY
jgi:hypothetical protein